jgi:hypothetical protein
MCLIRFCNLSRYNHLREGLIIQMKLITFVLFWSLKWIFNLPSPSQTLKILGLVSLRKLKPVKPHYKQRNRMFPVIELCRFLFFLRLYFCRFGFDGRECLLRTICDVAGNSLHENKQNGLLGDLVYIIFTYVKLRYFINSLPIHVTS